VFLFPPFSKHVTKDITAITQNSWRCDTSQFNSATTEYHTMEKSIETGSGVTITNVDTLNK